ncbi:hypothetical protein ES708_24493 [subsurface metagenome]
MPSKTIVAIIAIVIILGFAMWRNIDGALIGTGLTIIGGLGGYALGKAKKS